MIQLATVFWLAVLTFAMIGYLRGFDKELVAMAGILLSIFILVQFNSFFTTITEGAANPPRTLYLIQASVLLVVAFFAYQTPAERFAALRRGEVKRSARDAFQNQVLGSLTGGMNGYLLFGTLWYFLHEKGYPLTAISAPLPESASAGLVDSLPLSWLLDGNLLTLLVVGLFLFILIAII
jgi:uncharacterized membrane protein required for colicin V production